MLALRLISMLCVVVTLVSTAVGCQSARRKVDGDIVHTVDFEGIGPPIVRPFSKAELRSAMAQKASGLGVRTPGLTWAARTAALDRDALDLDTYRIESWLAHHGYFDARVEGWRIVRKRRQVLRRDGSIRKAGIVDVIAEVEFGEPSLVRELEVVWADKRADRFWRASQVGTLKRTSASQPGDTFNLDYVDYAVADLVRRMRESGYYWAEAEARIEAFPAEHAVDVFIEANTGPATVVGEIRIEGNERVPDELIREVIDLEEGEVLNSQVTQVAQQHLIGTEVFNVVRVEPDASDKEAEVVPLTLSLKEGRFGTARFGFGTVYDGQTITPRLSTTITNVNIDRDLARFEASANIGWGVPLQGGVDASRILYGISAGISKPRVFGPKWDVSASAGFQRDLLAGQLLYTRARLSSAVSHRFNDHVIARLGPSGEVVRLGPGPLFVEGKTDALSELDTLLVTATYGGNPNSVRNPFLLPLLEGGVTWDYRKGEQGADVALDPRRGHFFQINLRQALSPAFHFSDVSGEARFYVSPLSRDGRRVPYTFAFRARGRAIPGRADTFQDNVPFSERAFLGGSFDMRSFRLQQVGAYDCVCLAEEEPIVSGPFWPFTRDTGGTRVEANPTFLPRGGRYMGLLSGEVRRRWDSGRGVALFLDGGVLARGLNELAPRNLPHSLRWGGGIGFRQDTPVGPVRIDLAFRPRYPEDDAPQRADVVTTPAGPSDPTYYQGQYYGCDVIPDSRLPSRATGITAFGWEPPVIMNLSIAIGQAL